MKRWVWKEILSITIIVLAFLYAITYIFLFFQGKSIITEQLELLTQKKVSIDYFNITPLLNLRIKKLDIKGLAKADYIYISPSITGILTGKLVLNDTRIIKPEFNYSRTPPRVIELSEGPAMPVTTAEPKRKLPMRLIFKRLKIKDGKLNFIDHTVGTDGIKIIIQNIDFNLTNAYVFPSSLITNFNLKARIPWQEDGQDGKIEAEGWLNLVKKNMEATLKIEDIDGVYLYPYYTQWVDLEKARIEKAKLKFNSNIHGLNNNVVADCHLELTDIVRKSRSPEEEADKAEEITDAVLGIFRALDQGNIVLDFTIRTKMDKPQFGFGNIKMAFEDKLAQARKVNGFKVENVLKLPGNLLQGTVKGVTDLTKAVINGAASVGKEFKKAVEDTFKK